jgi:hypothetical protein
MEEQGFQWAEATPPPTPPASYALGQLVEDLRRFGEDYYRTANHIREENPITARHSWIQLAAHVSGARACLLAIHSFTELREWMRSEWGEEISFAACRRIVDTLVERSRGRLSSYAAEGLSLSEAVARLSALPGEVKDQNEGALTGGKIASTRKRSTERGEGRAKLIAALTKHHQYADGGCLNLEPIGNNELANAAGVSPSTASTFFNNEFDGHTKYKAVCRDSGQLVAAIKLLNNEFSPQHLYGRRPTGEDDRDEE